MKNWLNLFHAIQTVQSLFKEVNFNSILFRLVFNEYILNIFSFIKVQAWEPGFVWKSQFPQLRIFKPSKELPSSPIKVGGRSVQAFRGTLWLAWEPIVVQVTHSYSRRLSAIFPDKSRPTQFRISKVCFCFVFFCIYFLANV